MKKIKLYLMIGMMAVGLAGCGQTGSQPEGQSGGQAEEQTGSRTEGQTGSQSEDQSSDGTEGQSGGRAEGQTGSQSQDRTGGQANSQPEGQGESQAGQPDAGADAAYTFTDDLGREVTVESYERVATLLGSYADMWILAGGDVCAAPDDAFVDLDLPLGEDTVNLGETKRLSLELLLSADPDFVLASTNTSQHLEWQSSLEEIGRAHD